MSNLEVQMVSREIIKPTSPAIQHLKPFKICLFDQLVPSTYITYISFYSLAADQTKNVTTAAMALAQLKRSLSQTLDILYPFSGRIRDNLFIDRFDQGVPFLSCRTDRRLSEFLKHHETESLNKLLPCQPFTNENNVEDHPLLICQVTTFPCGGLALGFGMSHKISDVYTGFNFANVWSRICRGESHHEIPTLLLGGGSLVFPPRNSMPQCYVSTMEKFWFPAPDQANYKTRRFTFEPNSIAKIKTMAKGESAETTPTRVQALSCFIWKCFMEASRAVSESAKPCVLFQAVSLRTRWKSNLLNDSIGNLFCSATAASSAAETAGKKLSELGDIVRESFESVDNEEYLDFLQDDHGQGLGAVSEFVGQLETMFSSVEKPDTLRFLSWCNVGFYKIDYGWGNPTWVVPYGKVGSSAGNVIVLVETKSGQGIEAWITLDEKRMLALEKDAEFLKFASPKLKISRL